MGFLRVFYRKFWGFVGQIVEGLGGFRDWRLVIDSDYSLFSYCCRRVTSEWIDRGLQGSKRFGVLVILV